MTPGNRNSGTTRTPADLRVPASAGDDGAAPYQQEADAVLAAQESSADLGLSSAEAARRLERDGPNELRSAPPVPLWRRVLAQFQDPLVYLLLVAIAISVAAWVIEGAAGVPIDALVIALILILNAVIGFIQESKAEDAVAALADMTAATSTVLRGGREETIPSSELVVGDILVLSEGDSVGADARLITATSLRIQEASLTGESEATSKRPARIEDTVALGDRANMVFKGTSVVQGVGRAVVTGTGMATEMGAIADMLQSTEEDETPLTREITKVSKTLGILVIIIAVVVMAALAIINGIDTSEDAVDILLTGVSLAVAAVPEGLPAILSLVLAIGVRALAARNAVMKDLHSVETLGAASVICSDKTGTLTRNEMTLVRVQTPSGLIALTGTGYRPDGEATVLDGDPETVLHEARAALVAGSLANDAKLYDEADDWRIQGDPTEGAFLVALRKLPGAIDDAGRFHREGEVPFTSERKMMSTLDSDGEERLVFSKGAPDVLLGHCDRIAVGEEILPLDETWRERVLASVEEMSGEAYRTLGVANRPADADGDGEFDENAERDLIFLGVVGIIDPPRDEVADAVETAHNAGIRTIMITGDHPRTASRIARDLGITAPDDERALTGLELDAMDEQEFAEATREVNVYARVAPENKLAIVDALQADGQVVAMTGDGVNDAPALKTSDIGVAMGITGTEVTKQAATLVLGDDNYGTIVSAVHQGRIIYDNIKKFLRYLLSSNMGEVATVFFGVVLAGYLGLTEASSGGVVVPLLATQILWINLVTDSGPALAMGVDPEIDDVMKRRPRDPAAPILDRAMWRKILFIGLVMGAVTLLVLDMFLPGGMIEGTDSLDVARTAAFTTLVFAQLFNALNARSATESAFKRMFANPWLWGAIALGAVLQVAVVELPFLQVAFGTASLDLAHWAWAVGMASIVLWAEELAKIWLRARERSRAGAADGAR